MAINRKFFFDQVHIRLFDGGLKQSQVDGLTAILDRWEGKMPGEDDRWLAYMLGTAHHETGRTMQPVRETFAATDDRAIAILERAYAAGKLTWVKTPYWRKDEAGRSWLGRGLVQEVVALRAAHALDPALPSMRSVGYRQVWQYLDGAFDLAALREKGIAATRQLAKRQLTWLRGMQNVERFDCLAPDLAEQVFEAVQTRLTGTE